MGQQVTSGHRPVESEVAPRCGRIRADIIAQVTLAVMSHGQDTVQGRRRARRSSDRRGDHSRRPRVHVGYRRGQPRDRLMALLNTPLITAVITAAYTKTTHTEITGRIVRSGGRAAEISGDLPAAITTATTDDGRKTQAPIEIRMVLLVTSIVIQITRGHTDIDFRQITDTIIVTAILLIIIIIPIIITPVTGLRHVLRWIRIGAQVALVLPPVTDTTIVDTTEDTPRTRATVVGALMAITIVRLIVPIITASGTHRTKRSRDNFHRTSRPGNTKRMTLSRAKTMRVTKRSLASTEICRRIGGLVMTSRRADGITTTGRILDFIVPALIALLRRLGMFS